MGIVKWIISRFAFAQRSVKKQTDKCQQKETKQINIEQVWEQFHKSQDDKSRNLLMEHYRPIVKYVAERLHSKLPDKVKLDALISAGTFGLMDAIEAFDPKRGVKFETYCTPRIRGAVLDELRSMDRVPRIVRASADRLAKAEKDVPETDAINDKKSENPLIEAQKHDLKNLLTKGLTRAERLIVVLYYYEEMTMKEIAASLNLSESRVSQMHSSIVQRLKAQMNTRTNEFANKEQRPREQHYLFAHETMKDLFFRAPKKVFDDLKDVNWKEFLFKIWDKAGKDLERFCLVVHDGLSREIRIRDDNVTVSLITLPKPQVISEAYFIALVYCPWKLNFLSKRKRIPRFLLLEHSLPCGYGNQSTALHEWTADGKHINLGYGCEPTIEAFYEAVCNLL